MTARIDAGIASKATNRKRRLLPVLLGLAAVAFMSQAEAQTAPAWKFAAPLPKAMGELVATTVGDKIYVMSGLDTAPGPKFQTPTGFNWQYDSAADAWTEKKSMPLPAHHISVVAWHGKIYVFGGFLRPSTLAWQPTGKSWVYDPAADSWTPIADMPTPRGAGQAVLLDDKIYVIGGVKSSAKDDPGAAIPIGSPEQRVIGTTEVYDPATDKWESRETMPTARNHYLAAASGGKIYAIDGRIGTSFVTFSDVIDELEVYDPAKDHWLFAGRAPVTRGDVTGVAYNGIIYVAGGEFQDTARKMTFWAVEAFDPKTGNWGNLPHMQVARHGFAAALVGNKLHVMGGGFQSDGMPGTNVALASHEVFDLPEK